MKSLLCFWLIFLLVLVNGQNFESKAEAEVVANVSRPTKGGIIFHPYTGSYEPTNANNNKNYINNTNSVIVNRRRMGNPRNPWGNKRFGSRGDLSYKYVFNPSAPIRKAPKRIPNPLMWGP